ncbi:hypothetical protein F5148DRAFT_980146 [Russula earlei]|uniref:Uncharacterized protein n=1 Tax=Russula earlei TaxID=71964 RepID=A0ACC0U934_9AGAM|nr:hypothetical protein F5148DRAFT_980146 [Russula earlei]
MPSFDFHGSVLLYRVISIIFQTLFYGIYLCLVPISVYVMMSKGLKVRSRKLLFGMTTIMFVLSSIYWISSVVVTFMVIDAWFSELDPATHQAPDWLPMFSAVLLVNYTLADVVVVWRAWVLCSEQHRAILIAPVVCLVLNALSYLITVAVRAGLLITPEDVRIHRNLAQVIDVMQVADLGLSLLTNILATAIIGVKAWKYRQVLVKGGPYSQTRTPAGKLMALLIESGVLYVLIGLTIFASLFIPLPFQTLGDILVPVGVQLAGMYPIAVLLLMDQNYSFDTTTYISSGSVLDISSSRISRIEPMTFRSGPESGNGLTSATEDRKLPHANAFITFMEIDDDVERTAGSSAGSGEARFS